MLAYARQSRFYCMCTPRTAKIAVLESAKRGMRARLFAVEVLAPF
jgi:hypothetical protein